MREMQQTSPRLPTRRTVLIVVGAFAFVGLTTALLNLQQRNDHAKWRKQDQDLVRIRIRGLNLALVDYASTYNRGWPPSLSVMGRRRFFLG